MTEVNLPNVKELLWQQMDADLRSFIPHFPNNEIMCPACLRHVKFGELSLEHIIPQQAVALDPVEVREAITRNQRSGLTLLCKKPLIFKGKQILGSGCNGWKGKYFDRFVRELLNSDAGTIKFSSRHQVSMFAVGYLALFSKFGYRVALSSGGLLMRRQFFAPNAFLNDVPHKYQIILGGQVLTQFDAHNRSYWSDPFNFHIEEDSVCLAIRSMGFFLPLSEDPTIPLARVLRYVPPRYKLRPNLETVFE
jgi:hypothetical protein